MKASQYDLKISMAAILLIDKEYEHIYFDKNINIILYIVVGMNYE